MNAIIACLEDSNQLVRRNVLDLLNSHFNIFESEILTEESKLIIIQGCLLLFIKKENSTERRIDQWFFGVPDSDNKSMITEQNKAIIDYIVKAMKQILKQHLDAEQSAVLESQRQVPLKILQNFYMNHDYVIEPTIGKLSYKLIQFMLKFRGQKEFAKSTAHLFTSIRSMSEIIIESLLDRLIKNLKTDKKPRQDAKVLEIINLIYYVFDLLKNQEFDSEQIISCKKLVIMKLLAHISKNAVPDDVLNKCYLQ